MYDEQIDATETISLANNLEHKALLDTLVKHLPSVSSAALPETLKMPAQGKTKPNANEKPSATRASSDRSVKFDKLDEGKAGKISLGGSVRWRLTEVRSWITEGCPKRSDS